MEMIGFFAICFHVYVYQRRLENDKSDWWLDFHGLFVIGQAVRYESSKIAELNLFHSIKGKLGEALACSRHRD
jgi:hypothetical protein